MKHKIKTALIIPDCHFSAEESCDYRAYSLMLKVAQKQKIDEVVILGDFCDFFGISSHSKSPASSNKLIDEVERVKKELQKLRKVFKKAKIVFIQGNHEYRLERYIQNNAPELFGLLNLPELLDFAALNIHFIPYGPSQLYQVLKSKLYARHEPISGGVNFAHGTVVKAGCSVIFGHVHQIQESQTVMIDGNNHRGIACGWLGNKNHPIMSYVKNHHQWSQGFALVTVLGNGTFFCEMKHIIDYKVVHKGEVVNG